MKIKYFSFVFLVVFLCGRLEPHVAQSKNCLRDVKVYSYEDYSLQAMFFFTGPCKPILRTNNNGTSRLVIFFPNVSLGNVDKQGIMRQFTRLGIVKSVRLDYGKNVKHSRGESPGVLLDVSFMPNKALVQASSTPDKTRYTLEMFSKDKLDQYRKAFDGPLYLAYNQTATTMSASAFLQKKKFRNRPMRVVVDAGHGGTSKGAVGFGGLTEKYVTLDVARRLKPMLEQLGCSVLMTRNTDKDVSLLERRKMTHAFNADLFISVHANSSGGSHRPSGIETFHLDMKPFIASTSGSNGFIFAQPGVDEQHIKTTHVLRLKKDVLSSKLAQSVQGSLISSLKKNNINVIDRGVKKAGFLVLHWGSTPSALVEVGFLTNKDEAARLAQGAYRQLLARGICRGIKDFMTVRHAA